MERTRFEMLKERHCKRLENAIACSEADEKTVSICTFINSTRHYFTSSSCSGRIILLSLSNDEHKGKSKFHAKWHRKVKLGELRKELNRKSKNNLWFKLEPFCFLIGTENLARAVKVLEACRNAGVKRAGINVVKEGKFLIEIFGSNYLSFKVKEKNKILASKEFLKKQLETANKKLEANFKRLEEFEKELKASIE